MLYYRAWRDKCRRTLGGVDVTITIPPQLADAVDEDDEDDCPGRLQWLACSRSSPRRSRQAGSSSSASRISGGARVASSCSTTSSTQPARADRAGPPRPHARDDQASRSRAVPTLADPLLHDPSRLRRDPAPAHPDRPRGRRERPDDRPALRRRDRELGRKDGITCTSAFAYRASADLTSAMTTTGRRGADGDGRTRPNPTRCELISSAPRIRRQRSGTSRKRGPRRRMPRGG